MTQQEAQKIQSAFNNGFEYPFGQGGFLEKCDMDEVQRHAELLEEAVEKQIPKKPIQIALPNGNRYLGCPRCKQTVHWSRIYGRYCFCCGQALEREERRGPEGGLI